MKVFTTIREPNFGEPWTKRPPYEATGSGVILDGGFLITNAHVVTYAQRIEVQPNGSTDRFEAEIAYLSFDDDLALLRLEDTSFFETFPSVALARVLPAVGSEVEVAGFPTGGDELSKTSGIVSRLLYRRGDGFTGLAIQVDAPINEGNSGGPVFQDGEVVGIAFQKNKEAQTDNVGYLIPTETVQRFLDDVADGSFEGARSLPVTWSKCESPAMREHLGLSDDQNGILLYPSMYWTPPGLGIRPLDVLLAIDGRSVDNYGRIELDNGLMVEWEYQVSWSGADGGLDLTIWRDKQLLEVRAETVLETPRRMLDLRGEYPSYYIYGPVTFIEVSVQFLNSCHPTYLGLQQKRGWPVVQEIYEPPSAESERLVVTTHSLLSHRIQKGYDPLLWSLLRKVDGVPVRDLRHLASLLEEHGPEATFLEFDSGGIHDTNNPDRRGKQDLVFKHSEVLRTREEILETAGIRRHYSKDLADLIRD